jgi:hypothetical protein
MNRATGLLIPTTLLFGFATGVGIYQHVVNIPRWFATPPRSFELVRQSANVEARFWIPLQASIALLLIASLVLNWRSPAQRTLLVTAFVAYLVVWVTTGIYFAPEIVRFSQLSPDVSWTTELATRANRWVMFSWIRPLFMVVANAALLIAVARHD